MEYYSIAIDGPAGAGKSTVAKKVAAALGYIYVDTGAMYRAMALHFLRNNVTDTEFEKMEALCDSADVTIRYENGVQIVYLNGENVNGLIRTEEVSHMTSVSSAVKKVRLKMVELQRKLAESENVVMDGRDIGSYVLPNANLKIYLTADVSVRGKRRFDELTARGEVCDLQEICESIRERDYRDSHREFSPLVKAEDAVTVDDSYLSIEETADTIIAYTKK